MSICAATARCSCRAASPYERVKGRTGERVRLSPVHPLTPPCGRWVLVVIDWLVQSVAAHPALSRGVAPAGLLSEREQKLLAALRIGKRRRDWLIGRWTAKHLLQAYIERQTGIRPPLNTLTVANDPDGAPRAILDLRIPILDCDLDLKSKIQNLKLSVSHCNGSAFCALTDTPDLRIGADIERVERRSAQFAEDYFTAHELDQVRAAQPASRDTMVTLIWSAKEAALKALRLGLTVDTRSVICSFGIPEHVDDWIGFDIACDRRLLGLPSAPVLTGWWRQMSSYVLTLAATS